MEQKISRKRFDETGTEIKRNLSHPMFNEMKKGNVFDVIVGIILVALLIAFFISYRINHKVEIEYQSIRDVAKMEHPFKEGQTDPLKRQIDFSGLQKINPEIVAWIYIPGTPIDYPILQSKDSEDFYLRKNIYKDFDINGSLYSRLREGPFPQDVDVVYGHNLRSGSMFGTLKNYKNDGYFMSHQDLYLYTPKGTTLYQAYSSHTVSNKCIEDLFNNFKTEKDKEAFISFMQDISGGVLDESKELTVKNKILTLSTCADNHKDRVLVHFVERQ